MTTDGMDRKDIYLHIYDEIGRYYNGAENSVFNACWPDLLPMVSALTDAVEVGIVGLSEAEIVLREKVDAVRRRLEEAAKPPEPPKEGTINFG